MVVEPVGAPEHQRAQDDRPRSGYILPVLLGLTDDALVVAEADRGALVEGQTHADVEADDVAGIDFADELGGRLREPLRRAGQHRARDVLALEVVQVAEARSEEHTSEIQSLMRIS